jgi:hypothetical protein
MDDSPCYEPRDAEMSGVGLGIALFFAIVVLCLLVSAGLYRSWEGRPEGRDGRPDRPGYASGSASMSADGRAGRPSLPSSEREGREFSFRHGPDAETDIERDWRAQTAAVKDHLENYGWVDRAGGWVRIPIERAMELSAQESAQRPSPK